MTWDYDEDHWDFARDGYVKVVRFGKTIYEHPSEAPFVCELCGEPYIHFFVSNKVWALVPDDKRGLKLCARCWAES